MTKERGAKYYRDRLRAENPAIYADILAGKISVRAAAILAGLVIKPTRADALVREWKRASAAERKEFVSRVKPSGGGKTSATAPITDPSGRLIPAVIAFIKDRLRKDRKTPGYLLSKIGKHSNHDIRMSRALKGDKLPPEFLADLESWLRRNGYA